MRKIGNKQLELLRLMADGAAIYAPTNAVVKIVVDGKEHKPFAHEFSRVNTHKLIKDGLIEDMIHNGNRYDWYELSNLGYQYLKDVVVGTGGEASPAVLVPDAEPTDA